MAGAHFLLVGHLLDRLVIDGAHRLVRERRLAGVAQHRFHQSLVAEKGEPPLEVSAVGNLVGLGVSSKHKHVGDVIDQPVALGLRRARRNVLPDILLRERKIALPNVSPVDLCDDRVIGGGRRRSLRGRSLRCRGGGRRGLRRRSAVGGKGNCEREGRAGADASALRAGGLRIQGKGRRGHRGSLTRFLPDREEYASLHRSASLATALVPRREARHDCGKRQLTSPGPPPISRRLAGASVGRRHLASLTRKACLDRDVFGQNAGRARLLGCA